MKLDELQKPIITSVQPPNEDSLEGHGTLTKGFIGILTKTKPG